MVNGTVNAGVGSLASRLTVLLAEDDANLRSMLAIVIRRDGHRVREFRDGGELRAHLRGMSAENRRALDDVLVVTDLRMPDVDGLTLMQELRGLGRPLPFILLTAFGSSEVHTAARALGAISVLDKPFDFDDLREVIRSHLRERFGGPGGPPGEP
jgi:DNA-binding response OmpR family regulator